MKKTISSAALALIVLVAVILTSCGKKWTEEQKGSFNLIKNKDGQNISYSPASGVKILTVNGYAFKDLNKNGKLDKYEDWRLTADERAKDLASAMSVEQIAGLMLYSSHQSIPAMGGGFFAGATYNGKPFKESGSKSSDLSDQQKTFLTEDNVRHVLITSVETPEVAAMWNNNAQALAECLGLGIPVNISSDPRHAIDIFAEFNVGAGGRISKPGQPRGT